MAQENSQVVEAQVAAENVTAPAGQENSGVETVESNDNGAQGTPAGTEGDSKKTGGDDETPLWAKKRFAELTRSRSEAQREAEQLRQELYRIQQKVEAEPPKGRDDFLDEADYHRHLVRQETQAIRAEELKQQAEQNRQNHDVQKQAQTWAGKVQQVLTELPDYQKVISEAVDVPLDIDTRNFLVESPIGPKIAYWLATNPDKAQGLSELSPKAKERELLKIELRLEATPPKSNAATPVSQAPKPVASAQGVGSGGTATPPEKMSDSDWIKWRQKQVRGRK